MKPSGPALAALASFTIIFAVLTGASYLSTLGIGFGDRDDSGTIALTSGGRFLLIWSRAEPPQGLHMILWPVAYVDACLKAMRADGRGVFSDSVLWCSEPSSFSLSFSMYPPLLAECLVLAALVIARFSR